MAAGLQPMSIEQATVIVVGTPGRAAFADAMLLGLHEGLWKCGVKSHLFLLDRDEDVETIRAFVRDNKIIADDLFIVDLNGNFNAAPIPERSARMRFSLLIDHPYFHCRKFTGYPHPLTLGAVDASHASALKDRGVETPVVFLPHAGPEPEPAPAPMKDRDIDLLFCGNIPEMVFDEVFEQALATLIDDHQSIVRAAIGRILEEGSDIHSAFKAACMDAGYDLADMALDDLCAMITIIESFSSGKLRLKYLGELINIDGPAIHMVGGLEEIFRQSGAFDPASGVVFHGPLPFTEVKSMMRRAKISVNANFTIAGGSHERIWQGMGMGAVTLTNESAFMRSCFTEGESILFFPRQAEDLPSIVTGALADEERLQAMADAARTLYAAAHTWQQRVKTILHVFENAP